MENDVDVFGIANGTHHLIHFVALYALPVARKQTQKTIQHSSTIRLSFNFNQFGQQVPMNPNE